MKMKTVLNYALVGSILPLLVICGFRCSKAEMENADRFSNETEQMPNEGRLEYLGRVRARTYKRSMEKIFHGQYAEAVNIAEEAITELKDSDFEDYPAMAGGFYSLVGTVSNSARLELWGKATSAYEKDLEIFETEKARRLYAA